jgi:hypothetical protein
LRLPRGRFDQDAGQLDASRLLLTREGRVGVKPRRVMFHGLTGTLQPDRCNTFGRLLPQRS